jgi:uncharacterized protein
MMIIDLNDVLVENYAEIELDFEEDIDAIKTEVKGILRNINGVLQIKADIKAVYMSECARCLKKLESHIEKTVVESIVSVDNKEDEDDYVYEGKTLDLERIIKDCVYLSKPSRLLCKIDCKGMCIICGSDLNIEECNCRKNEINPKFGVLEDYFKNRTES